MQQPTKSMDRRTVPDVGSLEAGSALVHYHFNAEPGSALVRYVFAAFEADTSAAQKGSRSLGRRSTSTVAGK